MKKRYIVDVFFIFIVVVTIGIFVVDFKLNKDLLKIKDNMDYGYDFFCTDDFLELLNKDTNNIFSAYRKKKQIEKMLSDKSCYISNGIVPIVYVFTKDNDGINLHKEDGYVDSQIVFIDAEGNYLNDYESKIKIRGNSTSEASKKPYNIKFSEKKDLLGFGKAKKWNLLAECFDPTLVRNKLFLDLAYNLGLDNTSRNQYVELYIDQIYMGCYLLTEAVEVGNNRVDIDIDNGDFLIEYEKEKTEDGVHYIVTKHNIRFALCEPDELDKNRLKEIEEIINKFDEILFSNNYQELKSFIDIDSFVKVYLVNEFAKTVDIGYSSVYFYYKDGKMYAGPVWDFDISSGNSDKQIKNGYWNNEVSYKGFWCRENNIIYRQLFDYSEFERRFKDIFDNNSKLLQDIYDDDGTIDNILNTYEWLFDKNYMCIENGGAGWDIALRYGGVEIDRLNTYQENLNYLRTWLKKRFDWLVYNS